MRLGLFSPPTGTYGGLARGLAVAAAARSRIEEFHVAARASTTAL
jgi:hypothetical protein